MKNETNLTTQSFTTAQPFLDRMEPLLLAGEARYGLMLGIAMNVVKQPDLYGKQPPYFAFAEDNTSSSIAAAACMTPPYGVVVYSEQSDPRPGLIAIAKDLIALGHRPPTVNGPEPICTLFAEIWTELTNIPAEVAMSERVFELRQVDHPRYSPGHLRQATQTDAELVAQWFVAFTDEAMHDLQLLTLEEARERAQLRIEHGTIYLWEDGEVVSLAGTARPTPHGITIGPVYTPPQFRGKGYASSCVAQLSQRLLDSGRDFCTLFTDLANPTSNHIYQSIGYRPVCDYTVYSFKNESHTH